MTSSVGVSIMTSSAVMVAGEASGGSGGGHGRGSTERDVGIVGDKGSPGSTGGSPPRGSGGGSTWNDTNSA